MAAFGNGPFRPASLYALGVFLFLGSVIGFYPRMRSLFWETTIAKVQSATFQTYKTNNLRHSPGVTTKLIIEYQFNITQSPYSGRYVGSEDPRVGNGPSSDQLGYVFIVYNPKHPGQSMVKQTASASELFLPTIGILFVAGGAVYSGIKKRKTKE
jgi:hypothetical protein